MSPLPDIPHEVAEFVDEARRDHDPALVDKLLSGAFEGDRVADELVAAFRQLPGGTGWRMLDQALTDGPDAVPDAPPQLAQLVAPTFEPPAWVDLDLVDAGALALWRSGGTNLGLALTCGSLAYGYQSARLTRPLAATGRLAQMAPRRLGETSRWVVAATKPGALRPGGEGLHPTLRVRMVHALVRAQLLESGRWDYPSWGTPLGATDSLVTAMGGFLVIPLRALRDLGVRLSRAELEAMTHQWAWIAYLMGVPERLLPRTYGEAIATVDAALALDCGPNEDSPKLMRALLYHGVELPFEDRLPGFAQRSARFFMAHFLAGFARRWMAPEMADRLAVPDTPLTYLAPMMRPLTLARELARASRLLGSDERIVRMELAFTERVMDARGGPRESIRPDEVERESIAAAA